jgi:hypothetical protein
MMFNNQSHLLMKMMLIDNMVNEISNGIFLIRVFLLYYMLQV